jgi:T1SS-143 domain-containing protein
MATDTTNIQSETVNSTVAHEGDVERATLTQGATQVQLPQGENVVRIQVTPGETIQLPFPQDAMIARLDDGNGNLAIKVGDITVILQGYIAATGEQEVTLVDASGAAIDVAAVVAATDPNLDIQTAAGPGAGDQGAGPDNNGGVFSPFDPLAGIGGLNGIGGLDPTALQYRLIEREGIIFEEIEEEDADTVPTVVNITQAPPVNEDDLHGRQENCDLIKRLEGDDDEPQEVSSSELQSFSREGGEPKWVLGKPYEDGNDPFDTKDHEEGSQTDTWFGSPEDGKSGLFPFISDDNNGPFPGGIDMDREPLSVTATVEANFFADLPGKLVLDVNGNGINDGPGDVPLIDQLEGMGLTSHGHQLTYMLLPEVPESAPGANDGTGQMVVAYYTVIKYGCPTNVVVFTIGVDDDIVNAGETNPAGNAEFGLTFTIYGVVDHPEKGEGVAGEDILNIEVPFFLQDSDSPPVPSDFPQPLVFQDIDDVPFLGEVCYASFCGFDVPIAIVKANLTIGHDETPGDQSTGYDSDLQPNKGTDQHTDDVDGGLAHYLIGKADDQLDDIAGGEGSGEDVDISYQQGILAQLSSEFLSNGNFCADALGVAKTYLDVSFGADGKAKGNDQAGDTKFKYDNTTPTDIDGNYVDDPTIEDWSNWNNKSDGTPTQPQDGTDKRAFELFMKDTSEGGSNEVLDSSKTNWTISVMVNGEPVVLSVYAFQLDANTIIGMASPSNFEDGDGNEGGDGNDYEEALQQNILVDNEGGLDGEGDGIPVFMLRLDPESGQLVFVQYHQINNPEDGNAAHPDYDNSANDPIHLYDADGNTLVFFEATDFDGDTVTAALEVSVIDDAPDAKDDKAVLNEETLYPDGNYDMVSGNLVLGKSNDGINNDFGKDKLSVDGDHTISALKYGNTVISFDFDNNTADTNVFGGGASDISNLTFDGHVVEFDTPHGHFKVVVDAFNSDPVAPGDNSWETHELGYYEYTANPGNNSEKAYYGLEQNAGGTELPGSIYGPNGILSKFNGVDLDSSGAWGTKTLTVGGKTYTGLGVNEHGDIDDNETDTGSGGEWIKIGFDGDVKAAKITVGALFDSEPDDGISPNFDNYNAEVLEWIAFDGNTEVGRGKILGDGDGLVDFYINVGVDFDKVILKPVDNGQGNSGNNSDFLLVGVKTCDELCIEEKLHYALEDVDGDYDWAKLTIDVLDGEPKINRHQSTLEITIDEDGLPDGNNNNTKDPEGDKFDNEGGTGKGADEDGLENTATGHISYNTYADGLGMIALNSTANLTTLDGKSVVFAWDPDTNTLIGYAAPDTDRVVISVEVSNVSDSGLDFEVVLHEPLDHPTNHYEDNLYFDFKVTVSDKDCDVDIVNVQVKIDDDVPEICAPGCSNLVVNGSFEDLGGQTFEAARGNWDVFASIPGWKSGQYDDQNGIPNGGSFTGMEIQAGAVTAASDGNNLLELDSDSTNENQQEPQNTNTYVYQDIAGTESGNSYMLSFDYQPRVHQDGTSTNDVEVYWNGQLIGTLSGDTAGWQNFQFVVPGGAGDSSRLLFKAVGSDDTSGGFIDNVWVSSCAVVDEDDLHDGSDNNKESLTVHGETGVKFGADGPGGFGNLSIASPQGLAHNGTPILMVAGPDGTFYGMAGATKVFTVEFTKNGGEYDGGYKFTLNNEIDHPEGQGENITNIVLNYTAYDKDGDGAQGQIGVKVVDDLPEACLEIDTAGTVDIDESPFNQRDDQNDANLPAKFLVHGPIIEWAMDGDSAVDVFADFNADTPGTAVLSVEVAAPGTDSGIDFVDQNGTHQNVVLTKEGDLVVGRVGAGPDAGKVVFAVGISADGKLEVAQYAPVQHDNTNNHDDSTDLINSALKIKLTVTDYDGDVATDTVDAGDLVKFYDDGPSVESWKNDKVWVEDDDLPPFGIDGGPGDDGAPSNTMGTLDHNYGTDGAGTTLLTSANLPGGMGFTQALSDGGKTLTIKQNGVDVIRVTLADDTSGNYTVTQLAPVMHPDQNNNFENNVEFTINYEVTDGDGDTADGSFKVNVDDDSVDADYDGTLTVAELGVAQIGTNLLANDEIGADQPGKVTQVKLGNTWHNVQQDADGSTFNINSDGSKDGDDNYVGTLTIDKNGNWTFTQTESSEANDITFEYRMEDADGDTDTAGFKVDLLDRPDLAPVNYNDKDSGDENAIQKHNVMIILDRSGSMSDDIDPNTPGDQTRLEIARAAIENLLAKYDQLGDVKVMIVQFASDGQRMEFWGTPQEALDYIDNNDPDGQYTSYSDALAFAGAGLGDNDGKIPGAPTTVYFLSDGVPTADGANSGTEDDEDHSLTNGQMTDWNTALEDNGVTKVYAVGVGPGISDSDGDLEDVANPNGNGNNSPVGEVIIVTDENGLAAELEDTVTATSIEGNVLDGSHTSGDGDNGVADVTADTPGNAPAHIYTLSHAGAGFAAAFTWDGNPANDAVGAGENAVIAGQIVSFDTEHGRMVFNMATGDYDFTPGSVTETETVVFHYGTMDSDGSTDAAGGDDADNANSVPGGADLVITINNVNQAPVANDDNAEGSENDPIFFDFATLFSNDSDPDGDLFTIISVQNPANGTVEIVGSQVKFTPNANYSGPASFQYTIQDAAGLTAVATVNISIVADNSAPEGNNDNVITSNSGSFVLRDEWLLRNDTDTETPTQLVIDSATAGTQSFFYDSTPNHSNANKTVTLDLDTEKNGGSTQFDYTVEDPEGLSDNVTVGVKYVSTGGGAAASNQLNGTDGGDIIIGDGSNETLNGGKGDDTLVGGGGNDVLNGGEGDDWLIYDDSDTFDGGTGFDMLKMVNGFDNQIDNETGESGEVNFVGRVDNIEAVDLRNGSTSDDFGNTGESGDDALSAADVIAMTDADNVLYILGDGDGAGAGADDEVRLDGNWANNGDVTVNDPSNSMIHGLTFTQYTLGGATVYVQTTVDVDNNN